MKKFCLFLLVCFLCVATANARPLSKGMTGEDVRRWQVFLIGQGLMNPPALGNFSDRTLKATIAFQRRQGLQGLGMVGDKTLAAARRLGFGSGGASPSSPFPRPASPASADDPEFVKPDAIPVTRTYAGRVDTVRWVTAFAAQNDQLGKAHRYHRAAGHRRWCAGYQIYMAGRDRLLRQWRAEIDSTGDTLDFIHQTQRLNP